MFLFDQLNNFNVLVFRLISFYEVRQILLLRKTYSNIRGFFLHGDW